DFPKQKRTTNCGFLECRLSIARRPTSIHIADDDLFTLDSHRFDHLCQQLAGASDERFALRIFIGAWCFSHEHQTSTVIAVCVNDLSAAFAQTTSGAIAYVAPDVFERFSCA